jgi:flagellin
MGVVLNTNSASLFATRALRSATQINDSTVSKLASGKKINRAADDAAGLSINEGVGLIDKMSEPVPPNSTVWGNDSVVRGTSATDFFSKGFQVGPRNTDVITVDFSDNNNIDNTISLQTFPLSPGTLSFGAITDLGAIQVGAPKVASYFANSFVKAGKIRDIDISIKNLTRMISVTDKYHARFTAAYDKLQEDKLSYSAFQSQILDTDYAKTASDYAKEQVRQNTSASILTQANAQVGFALNLLP